VQQLPEVIPLFSGRVREECSNPRVDLPRRSMVHCANVKESGGTPIDTILISWTNL
jgi:hypothetical protein